MSEPIEVKRNFIHNAANECISGMSALNMEACPVPVDEQQKIIDAQGYIFLSESDVWVKHAYTHFRAVCDNVIKAEKQKLKIHMALAKLLDTMPPDKQNEIGNIMTMVSEI